MTRTNPYTPAFLGALAARLSDVPLLGCCPTPHELLGKVRSKLFSILDAARPKWVGLDSLKPLARLRGYVMSHANRKVLLVARSLRPIILQTWELRLQPDGALVRLYEGPRSTIFRALAADLLTTWWLEIRHCHSESCGAMFLPSHGAQLYHDPVCSQRVR